MSAARHPLLPRIRLRVGVSGHRLPPKLPNQSEAPLRAIVDRILTTIVDAARAAEKDYVACAPPRSVRRSAASAARPASEFVIVSLLAEGSDRIVAGAGLAAGFILEAVLPLPRAEYAQDFKTQESAAKFAQLLAHASAVFELVGAADQRPRAYEAAGIIMLANVDFLIAIWDGKEAAGTGGTAQIISRALAAGIPVVWIDPQAPYAMRLAWSQPEDLPPADAGARPQDAFRPADEAAIADALRATIALPTPLEARRSLQQYLQERERNWNLCPWYPLLLCLFAGRRLRWTDFRLPSALSETMAQWKSYLTSLPADRAQRPVIESILLPAYSAADHLAVYYSLVYRSTYVFNFLFAAIAVALALGGLFFHDPMTKSYLVLSELAIIGAILVTWLCSNIRQWHRRWLDYRRLADGLRHLRILAPLGSAGSVDRPRRNLEVDETDWVEWYVWSLRRLIPPPDCVVDAAYLAALREAVRSAEIAGQLQYHAANAERNARLDARLHHAGQTLFGVTGGVCVLFLCLIWLVGLPRTHLDRELFLSSFTFITALLPTLGAALGAIHAQGDFRTVAKQSQRTANRLVAIDKILAEEEPTFARLADRMEKTSDILMADLLEWQTVFRTRPLSLPA